METYNSLALCIGMTVASIADNGQGLEVVFENGSFLFVNRNGEIAHGGFE